MEQNSNIKLEKDRIATVKRPCLGCGGAFVAAGPFNRLCTPCKDNEAWQSGGDFALHGREAANDN